MLGDFPPWVYRLAEAYRLARFVAVVTALAFVFVWSATAPAEAPVLTHTPWRP